ncbi:hypothetical protein CLV30_111142 [Haloactinopolyspora alba]|uniref:Amidohydrolase 3 domain-containing protein n=1 Tax=Haloactinopolyspora alba TaxID=648780 RepID=A0A2P8DYC3_9ACTN|nr:amidohydrolase [Haloactinopolyspora alba]PSL02187.1 hypothetical protein CLV30_111142 [Haloactinopolyspora alba]
MTTSTLYRNGRIYSPADPFATAMLVVDDRIAWVGPEGAADVHADDATDVVDLEDALVAPAFVDAHVHLTETGLARDGVDLTTVASVPEALDRVAEHARRRPGEAVLGFGWDEGDWPERRAPTRAELDRAGGGAPVYLARRDVHTAVVSSAVLRADRTIESADGYDDGTVRRDAHHRARHAARGSLDRTRLRALRREALRDAASRGIGAVHEMGAPHISESDDFAEVLALGREPDVPDVIGYWGGLHEVERAREFGAAGAGGDLNIDGSLGSRSARLSGDYADAPGEYGRLYLDVEEATAHVVACTRAGLQAGFHCIGDEAVRTGVTAVAEAVRQCGLAEVVACRHRLEHVEMPDPDLVAEMARLGIAASVQPGFDAAWGGPDGMYAQRLDAQRAGTLNPFASMARAGVLLAFGSDSPVTPLAGWETVRAAAQHHVREHRISARGAFSAATRGGWRAARIENAGVLAPGMLASFAVWEVPGELVVQAADERIAAWSTDPRSGVPGLPDLSPGVPLPRCRWTVVRGRTVWVE